MELIHQDTAACFVVAAEGADGFCEETLPKLRSVGLAEARKTALDVALCGATRFASKAEEDALTVPAILDADTAMQRISSLVAFSASRARIAGPYR